LRDRGPELDAVFGDGVVERLRVGVGDDEIDALDPGGDHVGDGVAACPPTPITVIGAEARRWPAVRC
jgi:hypothetical protein